MGLQEWMSNFPFKFPLAEVGQTLGSEEQGRSTKCPDRTGTGSVLLTGKVTLNLPPIAYVTARHCLLSWWPQASPPREANLEKPLSGLKAFPRSRQESFSSKMGRCGTVALWHIRCW